MYSLDINFLNDRAPLGEVKAKGKGIVVADRTALVTGMAVGIVPPLIIGAFSAWVYYNNQTLTQRLTELEQKSAVLANKKQELDSIRTQTQQIELENQAVAKVFNTTIKPMSALLQEIRDNVPPNIQVNIIQQEVLANATVATTTTAAAKPATPPPAPPAGTTAPGTPPAAPPPPVAPTSPQWENFTQKLKFQGTARSFDDVNDFQLTLQNSPFFNGKEVKIISANLKDNELQNRTISPEDAKKTEAELAAGPTNTPPVIKLPQVVEYNIEALVNNKPASEMTRELDRKGAIGLATRIETLRNKGVLP